MTLTDQIAVYAAFLSTALFGWEIYKYVNRGAKLKLQVGANKILLPDPIEEGRLWVSVRVTNISDQPALVEGLSFSIFNNIISQIRKKADSCFVIPNNPAGPQLPQLLKPGEQWTGFISQHNEDIDITSEARSKIVMIELKCGHRTKPLRKRLKVDAS